MPFFFLFSQIVIEKARKRQSSSLRRGIAVYLYRKRKELSNYRTNYPRGKQPTIAVAFKHQCSPTTAMLSPFFQPLYALHKKRPVVDLKYFTIWSPPQQVNTITQDENPHDKQTVKDGIVVRLSAHFAAVHFFGDETRAPHAHTRVSTLKKNNNKKERSNFFS